MNKINGRFAVLALMSATLLGTTQAAHAAKYLVNFKNKAAFNQVHSQFMLQQNLALGDVSFFADMGPAAQVEDSLKHLNTVVVDMDDAQIAELRASGLVEAIEPEMFHPAPLPIQGFQPWKPWNVDMNQILAASPAGAKTPYGITLVKSHEAWTVNGKGAGARVLVLDTGMDVNHPALAPNYEKGKDFNSMADSSDVTDQVGHGTHVAGTVAGVLFADGFSGVAPEAKILMGRVCGTQGCSNIAVSRGINWGIEEKVDVITMSLGGPLGSLSEKRAVEAADAAGITVIAASGNEGTPRVSYPAAFPTVIAVGAVDSTSTRASFSQYGPELDITAPGVAVVSAVPVGSGRETKVHVSGGAQSREVVSTGFAGSPEVTQPLTNELVDAGLGKPEDFTPAVKGKFALIARGEIAFIDKVKNAIAAGAAGAVIYNNAPGLIQGALTQDGSTVAIPAMMIEQVVGEELKTLLGAGDVASATIQTLRTDYSAFDGTSMATPHVAGVAALVKAANKSLTPAEVRELFRTSAKTLGPINEYGAGLVDAEAAVKKALGQ